MLGISVSHVPNGWSTRIASIFIFTFTAITMVVANTPSPAEECPAQYPYIDGALFSVIPHTKEQLSALANIVKDDCHFRLVIPEQVGKVNMPHVIVMRNGGETTMRNVTGGAQVSPVKSNSDNMVLNRNSRGMGRYLKTYKGHWKPVRKGEAISSHDSDSTRKKRQRDVSNKHTSDKLSSLTLAKETADDIADDDLYHDYFPLDVLTKRWRNLTRAYPRYVSMESIGQSIENRPIWILRVTAYNHTGNSSNERTLSPKVLINAAQHAREWATPAVATYLAERLAAHAEAGDEPWAGLLRQAEVGVAPMVNPDGYVYSYLVDRLWRKNRRVGPISTRDQCVGVDLNRNWDADYGGSYSTSRDPCEDIYIGSYVFSEPETSALAQFIRRSNVVAHADVHSFGQYILGPFGYSYVEPPNISAVIDLGKAVKTAVESPFGTQYHLGWGADNGLYPVSGSMSDWTFIQEIMSFTIEVRPESDLGPEGFLLEENKILPTCVELFEAFTVIIRYAAKNWSVADDDPGDSSSALSTGAIVGIVVAAVALIVIVAALFVFFLKRRKSDKPKG